MTATNAKGTSAASATSNPVVPLVAQSPLPPSSPRCFSRSGGLVVDWSAPSLAGGDPLTGYTLTATGGASPITTTVTKTPTTLTLTGLTNGTAYTLTLVATTKAGSSAPGTSTGTPAAPRHPRPPQPPGHPQRQRRPGGHLVGPRRPRVRRHHRLHGHHPGRDRDQRACGRATGSPTTTKPRGHGHHHHLTGLSATGFYAVSVAAVSSAGTGTGRHHRQPGHPDRPAGQLHRGAHPGHHERPGLDDSSGTLTWAAPAPAQVASLVTGDVLVGPTSTAAPDGLLATVTGVTDTSGTYVVTTTTASLSTPSPTSASATRGTPWPRPGPSFQAKAAGVRTLPAQPSVSLTLSHDLLHPRGRARSPAR